MQSEPQAAAQSPQTRSWSARWSTIDTTSTLEHTVDGSRGCQHWHHVQVLSPRWIRFLSWPQNQTVFQCQQWLMNRKLCIHRKAQPRGLRKKWLSRALFFSSEYWTFRRGGSQRQSSTTKTECKRRWSSRKSSQPSSWNPRIDPCTPVPLFLCRSSMSLLFWKRKMHTPK